MPDLICITGFLGSGKTTFLNRILPVALHRGKVALVENDFGDASIDADFLRRPELELKELNSGCVCCTLKGELQNALKLLVEEVAPDYIFIEPSGISCSSDLLAAIRPLLTDGVLSLGGFVNLVDLHNFADYVEMFGEFYRDQIRLASCLLLSHNQKIAPRRQEEFATLLRRENSRAGIFLSDWLPVPPESLWEFITTRPQDERAEPGGFSESGANASPAAFMAWHCPDLVPLDEDGLKKMLDVLDKAECGRILRAKGNIPAKNGAFWSVNYLPGTANYHLAESAPGKNASLVVIGLELKVELLAAILQAKAA